MDAVVQRNGVDLVPLHRALLSIEGVRDMSLLSFANGVGDPSLFLSRNSNCRYAPVDCCAMANRLSFLIEAIVSVSARIMSTSPDLRAVTVGGPVATFKKSRPFTFL